MRAHLLRSWRARLRVSSGPRSRLRVVTLTHPLLDPGIAYWVVDDTALMVDDTARPTAGEMWTDD
ncbi:hypothetical protein NS14008_36800 [Nocardia seriolae]|nr:hypothetical protein NS14008_36800 [Nocardia seriolae]PSK29378.1 hypothetical protein C6575_21480 [Nocardia seriolae]RLP30353.1 hypothetical protein D6158_19060 [Nocardia seriolae]